MKPIADLYEVLKDALIVPCTTVSLCTVRISIATSWRKETKYTASLLGSEFEERNQGEKTEKKTLLEILIGELNATNIK